MHERLGPFVAASRPHIHLFTVITLDLPIPQKTHRGVTDPPIFAWTVIEIGVGRAHAHGTATERTASLPALLSLAERPTSWAIAHTKPVSSRAIAVQTTVAFFPDRASVR